MSSLIEMRRVAAVGVTALALLGIAGAFAFSAAAQGITEQQLLAHGWTCVPFLPANRDSCFNPGTGRPFPGNPDPRPTYNFVAFDRTSGEFLYTGHLIR